jgi:outer membrane protein OmpA-like peptidoglycan-associated protein/tetratricopeptide (TPR) repeat protein
MKKINSNSIYISVSFLVFFTLKINAQTAQKAEKQYENIAYSSAIASYNKTGEPQTKTALSQVANSFRLNGDYENAEMYFANLMLQSPDKEDIMYYAQTLLSNGKCQDAVTWYQKYQAVANDKNRSFIASCEEIAAFPKKNITIKPLGGANSDKSEFAAIPFKGGVVLTSTQQGKNACKDHWTGEGFTDLYYADLNEGDVSNLKQFGSELNMKYHDGAATFNKAGNIMYFTRTNPTGKSSSNQRDLKIFISHYKNGNWSEAVEMPFNSNEFGTCHPTLSNDGKKLYFSSNRPGGSGGMDIWFSTLEYGRWSEPKNLGKEVNTSGNEIFPYVNDTNVVFFASNGHKGFGGLDIFSTENKDGIFTNVQNMGTPFNSPMDDFSYAEKSGGESGFLSSNRKGGVGTDDVYFWKKSDNQPLTENIAAKKEENQEKINYKATILFIDAATGEEIKTPSVTIAGPNKSPKQEVQNNISLEVVPNGQYTIKGEMTGYLANTITLEGIDLLKTPVYKIPLTKNDTKIPNAYEMLNNKPAFNGKTLKTGEVIEIQDIFYDYDKSNIRIDASAGLLRLAEVMLRYPSLEVELSSHTDSRGTSSYNQKLSQNRANEAVTYLISRGIAAKRMSAQGFGETHLTNNCGDGVSCTEEQHQRNRRTEVRVVKFEEEAVEIKRK